MKIMKKMWWGFALIIIGTLWVLDVLGIIDINLFTLLLGLRLIVPVTLVLVGFYIVIKGLLNQKAKERIETIRQERASVEEYRVVFHNKNIDYASEQFEGVELLTIFGGIQCDLSAAFITEDVVIHSCNVFGGINIHVPSNVNVKIVSTPVFGRTADKRQVRSKDNAITLYISSLCIFGGVEIN